MSFFRQLFHCVSQVPLRQRLLFLVAFATVGVVFNLNQVPVNRIQRGRNEEKNNLHFRYADTYLLGHKPFNYSFSDPKLYKGPIVEGWPPTKSRDMRDYIRPSEDTVLTDLSCLDLSSTKVLILIQSSPANFERRNANRETWIKFQTHYPLVKTLFLFGTNSPKETFMSIGPEHTINCDLVQMDFVDCYENVTFDTVSCLKFARNFDYGSGPGPDFIIIGDDDTYINIPMLWGLLYEEKAIERSSSFLLGYRYITPAVLKPDKPNATYVDRVISPSYMYDGDHYPDSMSGSAYVLPYDSIECLYQASLALPFFHLNDIFVASFAAERCGLERKGDQRFHPGEVRPQFFVPNDVTIHYSTSIRKSILHQVITKQNSMVRLKLPNHYYSPEGSEDLFFCDQQLECTKMNQY